MIEIETSDELLRLAAVSGKIEDRAFQSIDFTDCEYLFEGRVFSNCIFLGCSMGEKFSDNLLKTGNLIFPSMDVPFQTYPSKLYTKETIYDGFDPSDPESYSRTSDRKIYDHYIKNGKNSAGNIYETLARRLHDHGITDALMDILGEVNPRKVIAIMGGHSMSRSSEDFKSICLLAKKLSEKGFFLLSGGGPGAMEATHVGAWFNGYSADEMLHAVDILSEAPVYRDMGWLSAAFRVMEKYPRKSHRNYDIGIPTWLYGHEPPTPFASMIAKYFENSVREEGLLAFAKGGVLYTPGSAGTVQEIFQDFTQNFYNTYDIVSPMIFYNTRYWSEDKPVYPLLKKLSTDDDCDSLITISDSPEEILDLFLEFSSRDSA